jgi:hypothetical protein
MSVVWSVTSAAADLRENIHTRRLAGLQGDALLDAFRELTTLAFLQKCSPASVHNLRLFLFDNGVQVNMRAGSNSFYAVRALLPVPAVEPTCDPAPTEEDVRAANERMQLSEGPTGEAPRLLPNYADVIDMERSSDVSATQEGVSTPGTTASIAETQVTHLNVVSDDIQVPATSPRQVATYSTLATYPVPFPLAFIPSRRNTRNNSVFRPSYHGLVESVLPGGRYAPHVWRELDARPA